MGKGKYKKCFQDLSMSTLFGISIQLFFFSTLLLQNSTPSFHFTSQNLMRTLFIFFFLTLFPSSFFFFLLWILAQTTTLKQTDQISSWNTMDKGFKKERLIKRLNGVTSDNVSKKKKESVKKKEIERILIKFWEVKWKEGILFWRRRRGEKKIVEWKFQKELTFRQILKTLLIFTFTHFYFILFTFTLHYVLIKSLFDLEDCVVQILIWPRRKRCGANIFGILSWDYLFFLD